MFSIALFPEEVLKGSSNAILTEFKIMTIRINVSKIGCPTMA